MLLEINSTENPSDIEEIQVISAGFKKPSRKFWLSNLWIAMFITLKTDEAKAAVYTLNKHSFRTDPEQKYPSTLTSDITFAGRPCSSEAEVRRTSRTKRLKISLLSSHQTWKRILKKLEP